MRAAIFKENGGPEVITVEEVAPPVPGPGEVRIRVEAASLNHLDLWVRRGLPIETPMPHIGGSDMAGVVESVGSPDLEPWLDRRVVVDPSLHYEWYDLASLAAGPTPSFGVIGEHTQGGFAEYVSVPGANLLEIPDGVSSETAAAGALAGVTAWRGLMTRGALRPGESVLITGASGGVSTMAVQYAKAAGAVVHAITSTAQGVDRALDLGADFAYDRLEGDWGKSVYRNTGRRGVHLCLDSVGQAVWPQAVRALAVGGRLVSYGATSGPEGAFDIRLLFWKQLSLLGSTMGTHREFIEAMGLVFDGRIRPRIHDVMPLDRTAEAHRLLEAGAVFGKIVIKP